MSLSLRSNSSSEVTTASCQSSINKRKEMGMWLNLMPPGSHSCVLCSHDFNSLQTVGGYQNSDETLKFHAQMHNLYLKMIKEENLKKKERKKRKNTNYHPSKNVVLPNQLVGDKESRINLDQHHGFGPPKKVRLSMNRF
jgi:hypothetical protein